MEKFKMQHHLLIISGTSCIISIEIPETMNQSYTWHDMIKSSITNPQVR